jgi:SPP1 family predicted phage head-tail adaptor
MSGVDVPSSADVAVGSGPYNKPVTIQSSTVTVDVTGSSVKTWTNYIKTMAHIEPWKGFPVFIANQIHYTKLSKILIRYRPSQNIDGSMRILYKTRIYTIHNVMVPAEAQTTIEIIAEELLQSQGTL